VVVVLLLKPHLELLVVLVAVETAHPLETETQQSILVAVVVLVTLELMAVTAAQVS
jgi:hypothetical protein